MSTKREPKNLEEARALLVPLMPDGWSLSLRCRYYDSFDPKHRYTSVEWSCSMYPNNPVGAKAIEVEATSPARLVKESMRKLFTYIETFYPHRSLPAPRPARRPTASKKKPSRANPPRIAVTTNQGFLGFKRA